MLACAKVWVDLYSFSGVKVCCFLLRSVRSCKGLGASRLLQTLLLTLAKLGRRVWEHMLGKASTDLGLALSQYIDAWLEIRKTENNCGKIPLAGVSKVPCFLEALKYLTSKKHSFETPGKHSGRFSAARPDVLLLDEPTNHLDLQSVGGPDCLLKSERFTVSKEKHQEKTWKNMEKPWKIMENTRKNHGKR